MENYREWLFYENVKPQQQIEQQQFINLIYMQNG
jgi:hypothetical protein